MKHVTRILSLGVTPLAALLFLLGLHSWFGPDIWYHLTWGREFVMNGRFMPELRTLFIQPVPANGYWLFQSILYLFYGAGGLYAVSGFFIFAWAAIAALWLKLSDLIAKPWATWFGLAFILICQMRFEHRPEVISYLFILMMTGLALAGRVRSMIFLQIFWANMHGYFVFGPVIGGLLTWEKSKSLSKSAKIFVTLIAATGATPFGFRVWESVYLYFQLGRGLRDLNYELFSPPLWPLYLPTTIFWILWALTALRTAGWVMKRDRLGSVALALMGLVLSATAIRNGPLLLLLSLGVWRGLSYPKRFLPILVFSPAVAALALCYFTVTGAYHRYTTSLATFGVKLEWASYPIGAVEFLKARGFKGKLFTDSYDGGYVEYHMPEIKISGDSYFADPELTRRFFAAIKEPQALDAAHQEFKFDGLLLNIENTDVINFYLNNPEWILAYADSHRTVFLPRDLNPDLKGDFAQFTYYHGENLNHWVYEFGVVTWTAIAAMNQSPILMEKILRDLLPGKAIPANAFNIALKFASDHKDEQLVKLLSQF